MEQYQIRIKESDAFFETLIITCHIKRNVIDTIATIIKDVSKSYSINEMNIDNIHIKEISSDETIIELEYNKYLELIANKTTKEQIVTILYKLGVQKEQILRITYTQGIFELEGIWGVEIYDADLAKINCDVDKWPIIQKALKEEKITESKKMIEKFLKRILKINVDVKISDKNKKFSI